MNLDDVMTPVKMSILMPGSKEQLNGVSPPLLENLFELKLLEWIASNQKPEDVLKATVDNIAGILSESDLSDNHKKFVSACLFLIVEKFMKGTKEEEVEEDESNPLTDAFKEVFE